MKLSIKDCKDEIEIKIDDKTLTNVISYSISSDTNTAAISLVLELPKNQVDFKAEYWLIQR